MNYQLEYLFIYFWVRPVCLVSNVPWETWVPSRPTSHGKHPVPGWWRSKVTFWKEWRERRCRPDIPLYSSPHPSSPTLTPTRNCESCCNFKIMCFGMRQTWVWNLASPPTSWAHVGMLFDNTEPLFHHW